MSTAIELARQSVNADIAASKRAQDEAARQEQHRVRLIDEQLKKKKRYLAELAKDIDLVDRKVKPDNIKSYASAMAIRPEGVFTFSTPGPCKGGICACLDIEELRRQRGQRPANFDVITYCRKKQALMNPPRRRRGLFGALAALGDAISSVANTIEHIPVVGALVDIAGSAITEPFRLSIAIASGKNVGDALLDHWKREFATVKAAAPYIQAVIAFIPGIGTAASAALGFGLALLQGQPITQALLAGAEAAIPGGVLIHMAFSIGKDIISHKRIEDIAINAIPGIPEAAKNGIRIGAHLMRALATGEKVATAILHEAMAHVKELGALGLQGVQALGLDKVADSVMKSVHNIIPKNVQEQFGKVFATGMAIAHGKNLQELTSKVIETKPFIDTMVSKGRALILANDQVATAYGLLGKNADAMHGFQVAAGLLGGAMNSTAFLKAREVMTSADAKQGFDMGAAIHIGLATEKVLKAGANVQTRRAGTSKLTQVGSLLTRGMAFQSSAQKVALMKLVAANPESRAGAVVTIKQIANERGSNPLPPELTERHGLLHELLVLLGLASDDTGIVPAPRIGKATPVLAMAA